jgi:malate/lactate dehydrogenase
VWRETVHSERFLATPARTRPGVRGAALTVPGMLGRGGVRELHEWELSEEQRAGMASAAEAVRAAAAALRS